jgi:hypothetical protein
MALHPTVPTTIPVHRSTGDPLNRSNAHDERGGHDEI